MTRRRLDAELVRRKLASSREEAKSLIEAGRVRVAGTTAEKPTRMVDAAESLDVTGERSPYVGRGALKLGAALDAFSISAEDKYALDVGASTGGFTDLLLQQGAAHVDALDVGYGQLHERLRQDERVTSRERTNIRSVGPEDFEHAPFSLIVGDLSFISLRTVVGALRPLLAEAGDLILLIKPQFEVGRAEVSKNKGVIRDPELWESAVDDVVTRFGEEGLTVQGLIASPVTGADGNVEFLAWFRSDLPVAVNRQQIANVVDDVARGVRK